MACLITPASCDVDVVELFHVPQFLNNLFPIGFWMDVYSFPVCMRMCVGVCVPVPVPIYVPMCVRQRCSCVISRQVDICECSLVCLVEHFYECGCTVSLVFYNVCTFCMHFHGSAKQHVCLKRRLGVSMSGRVCECAKDVMPRTYLLNKY